MEDKEKWDWMQREFSSISRKQDDALKEIGKIKVENATLKTTLKVLSDNIKDMKGNNVDIATLKAETKASSKSWGTLSGGIIAFTVSVLSHIFQSLKE